MGKRRFKVSNGGRRLRVVDHQTVTVGLVGLRWLLTPRKDKHKRPIPRSVAFDITEITEMSWTNGVWWIWPGRLQLAPGDAARCDRWRRSGKARPHRFWFAGRGRTQAKLLRIAWVIQLAYAQAFAGALLAQGLPEQRPVPKSWVERLLNAARKHVYARAR